MGRLIQLYWTYRGGAELYTRDGLIMQCEQLLSSFTCTSINNNIDVCVWRLSVMYNSTINYYGI